MATAKKTTESPASVEPPVEPGLGKQEMPAATTESPAPKPPPMAKAKRYRVWEHGTLKHEGRRYCPGDVVDLPEDVAKTLLCLIPE